MIVAAKPYLEVGMFGLSSGAVFGLLAIGLVLIYRTTGTMNFAHWAVGLWGLVTYALLNGSGFPAVPAAVISIGFSIVGGVLAYRLVFRRVSRGNQVVTILIAIGVAQFYAALGALILGLKAFTKLNPWLPTNTVKVGSAFLSWSEIITAGSAVAIAIGFLFWFRLSRTGKALRAVAQNREAAMLAGIDDLKYSSIAWGIGSALAGLALLLVLPHTAGKQGGTISVFTTTPLGTLLIPAFGAALVGGLVNLPMALVGGLVFGMSQNLLILAPKPWSDLRSLLAAVLILVLLLLRTERFFATRQELEALET
jgi:branched-chain amino acid transport system permease protein